MVLSLYNQECDFTAAQEAFPINTKIGVKNPYKKLSFNGTLGIRNDNPENIIVIRKSKDV